MPGAFSLSAEIKKHLLSLKDRKSQVPARVPYSVFCAAEISAPGSFCALPTHTASVL